MSFTFSKSFIESLPDYQSFRAIINALLALNKTTGHNQSEEYISYTRLNAKRMERLDKTLSLSPQTLQRLKQLDKSLIWIVITEAWCGDSAQNLPYIAAMAQASNHKIDLRIALRDDNDSLMNAFLTDGARAIPKLIILNPDTLDVINVWGPRPYSAQNISYHYRLHKDTISHDDFEKQLHAWYAQNKGRELQNEILSLI
jgi:hypothetical protein